MVASIVAVLLGYGYLFVIRAVGGIIIYFTIAVTFIILLIAGFYSYFFARPKYDEDDPIHNYLAYTAYIVWGITGVLGLIVVCCFDSIQLGIAVFQTTAQYIACNMHIFLLPAIAFIVTAIWYVIWLSSAIYIFAVGTPEARENYPFVTEIKWSDETRYVLIYYVFALLWISAFIVGAVQFIIGASTCMWYFTVKTDTGGKDTVRKATWWFFRYHWPSIALGSLIIAICQFIRLVFEYYRKKMGSAENLNGFLKCLMISTSYCLWCLEKCVKYISKNAYIQIALHNYDFLPAAVCAFTLILKYAHKFGITNSIGYIYMLFGCFLISSTTCFGTYIFLTNYEMEITSPIPTTVAMGVISVAIGYQFLSIFSFSLDAILQSYLLDKELGRSKNADRKSVV